MSTYLPRVMLEVKELQVIVFRQSTGPSLSALGTLSLDGWKNAGGVEQWVSGLSGPQTTAVLDVLNTLGVRRNETYFIQIVVTSLTRIFENGGSVFCIVTDGAMADWHPALRAELQRKWPTRGFLIKTCAAHGASRFFADAFGVGRVAYSTARGNGTWLARVLDDSTSLIKFVMRHEFFKALLLAYPDALVLRQPQEPRMGGGCIVLERLLRDRRAICSLLALPATLQYVNRDPYGKRYKLEFERIYEMAVGTGAVTFWRGVEKAVVTLSPMYEALRLCDKGTPNLASVAMKFRAVTSMLINLPLVAPEVGGLTHGR